MIQIKYLTLEHLTDFFIFLNVIFIILNKKFIKNSIKIFSFTNFINQIKILS